ncbi:MAG: hypothetical protein MSA56_06035 [Clostridium sp.]|nr:hypothetical protein [Clostridium sp.]
MEKNILKIINEYEEKINGINNSHDMKMLVREIFKNEDIDDIDFNDLIYDYVIPRLKNLGVNMDYNEETAETNYERVMRENYE